MQKLFFNDDGFIPNSHFPVSISRNTFIFHVANESEAEKCIKEHVVEWKIEWLWKVYRRPHYHSTTHEALVVYRGSTTLRIGGHRLGKLIKVNQGDTIVIPGGVAHQNMGGTKDFLVFGLYPVGAKPWDLLFCRKKDREVALPNLALLGQPPRLVS